MRDSFIFERLWVEAIKKIENENTQLALYNAICNYGLYGTEAKCFILLNKSRPR